MWESKLPKPDVEKTCDSSTGWERREKWGDVGRGRCREGDVERVGGGAGG